MSYILEAIKKADQKRKLGSVPDLHSEHGSTVPNDSRARWPYWVAVVLFINAGLIGWWLSVSPEEDVGHEASVALKSHPTDQDETPVIASSPAGLENSPVRKEESSELFEKPSEQIEVVEPDVSTTTGGAESESVDVGQGGVVDKGLDQESPQAVAGSNPVVPISSKPIKGDDSSQNMKVSATEMAKAGEAVPPAVVEKAIPVPPAFIVGAGEVKPVEKDVSLELGAEGEIAGEIDRLDVDGQEPLVVGRSPEDESSESVTENDLVEEYKLKKEREADEKDLERLPFDYQLPESTSKMLPEFHISFHVYVSQPSDRIVSINGQILREGQALDKKTTLEQITPFGVVLLFDTWRFKVGID